MYERYLHLNICTYGQRVIVANTYSRRDTNLQLRQCAVFLVLHLRVDILDVATVHVHDLLLETRVYASAHLRQLRR